jgi:DNA-binding beta-propeller fold protein YncE
LLLCLAVAGCATVAGVLGLGEGEQLSRVAECDADSEQRPLARWSTISGELLVRSYDAGKAVNSYLRLTSPVAVAAQANDLYIADLGQRAILKYDRGTQTTRVFAKVPDLNVDSGVYLDRALSLYLADPLGSRVVRFDIDGKPLQTFQSTGELPRPVAVVVDDSRGEIFAADQLTARILVFNRAGLVIRAIGADVAEGVRFESVTAMAIGPDQLYVVDQLARRVYALSPDGTYRYTFGEEELKLPGAITLDSSNRVFVADEADNTIKVYRGGQLEAVVGAQGDPVGLGFRQLSAMWLSDGLLYVADMASASIDILRVVPSCE